MIYHIIAPCAELRDIVSHFWEAGWNMDRRQPNTTHYVVASSLAEITFAFKKNGSHASLSFTSLQGQGYEPKQLCVEGFSYLFGVSILNSDHNDVLFKNIDILEEKILTLLNDGKLFHINKLRKEVIEKRDDEIIRNVLHYNKEYSYNQALLLIGSGA